ncbi:MAG: DddA-like double-stranded DNA deaminase toxin [Haloechinothrix sp.]
MDRLEGHVEVADASSRSHGHARGEDHGLRGWLLAAVQVGRGWRVDTANRGTTDEARLPAAAAKFLSSHVEMKVAARMIDQRVQHSELVINNVPCRSKGALRPGCHETLSRYLSKGYTLTAHGTTQGGTPFSHTYEGQA